MSLKWKQRLWAVEGGEHCKDNVGHVALLCHHLQPRHGIHIAHDVSNESGTVLLHLNRPAKEPGDEYEEELTSSAEDMEQVQEGGGGE